MQILVIQGDKIITTYEEQPWIGKFHTLIGGVIDDGLTPEQAAHKELKEEAGIVSRDLQHLMSIHGIGRVQNIHFYITRDFDGPGAQNLDAGEKIELVSLSFQEFLDQMTQDDRRAGEFVLWASKKYFIPGKHAEFKKLCFG